MKGSSDKRYKTKARARQKFVGVQPLVCSLVYQMDKRQPKLCGCLSLFRANVCSAFFSLEVLEFIVAFDRSRSSEDDGVRIGFEIFSLGQEG